MSNLDSYKVHAYDVLAQMEALQKELQATNMLIAEEQKKATPAETEAPVEAPVEEVKAE
jgi:hypothetical protein